MFSPLALTQTLPFLPLAQGDIDYQVARRGDPDLFDTLFADPVTKVILVRGGLLAVPRGQGNAVNYASANMRLSTLPGAYAGSALAVHPGHQQFPTHHSLHSSIFRSPFQHTHSAPACQLLPQRPSRLAERLRPPLYFSRMAATMGGAPPCQKIFRDVEEIRPAVPYDRCRTTKGGGGTA